MIKFAPFSTLVILVVGLSNGLYGQGYSSSKTDSLLKKLHQVKDTELKIDLLTDLAFEYQYTTPKMGIEYGMRALHLAESIQSAKGKASANAMIGLNYASKGDYQSAIQYENEALNMYRQMHDKKGEAAMLTNIGVVYMNQSDYSNALELYYAALAIYESLGLKIQQANVLDNLGVIYAHRKKYPKALECYQTSLLIYQNLNDLNGVARMFGNQGAVYTTLKEYNNAIVFLKRAWQLNHQLGNKRGEEINLVNIGNVYLSKQEADSALHYYKLALKFALEADNQMSVAGITGNMGNAYLTLAKTNTSAKNVLLNKAEKLLQTALKSSDQLGNLEMHAEFIQSLAKLNEVKGNYKLAIELINKYNLLNDSIHSHAVEQRIYSLETSREQAIKNKNLQLKEQELRLNKLELENSNYRFYLLLFAIFITMLIIGYLMRKLLRQSQRSIHLDQENQKYAERLSQQLIDLQKHATVLKEMAYMQAHDVRGPVSSLLGLIELFNKQDLNSPDNKYVMENLEKVVRKLDEAVKNVIKKEQELRDKST